MRGLCQTHLLSLPLLPSLDTLQTHRLGPDELEALGQQRKSQVPAGQVQTPCAWGILGEEHLGHRGDISHITLSMVSNVVHGDKD